MRRYAVLTLGFWAFFGAGCFADMVYDVSLNTAGLVGNSNAPFALDFQLTSGDTSSGIVNAATVSEFRFGIGGGSGIGRPFANSGNAFGNLSSTAGLKTSGGTFFNEFSQYFMPGNTLTFQLDLTNNAQPALTPDEFTLQLIDKTAGEIPTTDPSGSDSLLVIDLSGSTLNPRIYTTNGDGVSITPVLQASGAPVPEPATAWLLAVAGTACYCVKKLCCTARCRPQS